jgi:hypothetical protein
VQDQGDVTSGKPIEIALDDGTSDGRSSIAGGGHGNFNAAQRTQAYVKIREFLTKNGLASQ